MREVRAGLSARCRECSMWHGWQRLSSGLCVLDFCRRESRTWNGIISLAHLLRLLCFSSEHNRREAFSTLRDVFVLSGTLRVENSVFPLWFTHLKKWQKMLFLCYSLWAVMSHWVLPAESSVYDSFFTTITLIFSNSLFDLTCWTVIEFVLCKHLSVGLKSDRNQLG